MLRVLNLLELRLNVEPVAATITSGVTETLLSSRKRRPAMDTVELTTAKDRLEDLVRLAAAGEDVRITDARYGTMRLTPVREGGPEVPPPKVTRYVDTLPPFVPLARNRVAGRLEGKLKVPAGLLDPMTEDELRDWYGVPDETLG
jgi:antitoxin (DNA-binding transcriptional repressor) of toxin-antitoxin stability system